MIRTPSFSIVILFAAAVFGPLAILVAAGTLTYQYIEQDAQRRVLRSTELVREHAVRVFDVYQLILGQVERRAGSREWDKLIASRELHEDLRSLTEPVREASSVFYLAPTGRHVSSSTRHPMPSIDATGRDYFVSQRSSPSTLFISTPAKGLLSLQELFSVTRARLGRDGRFDGLFGVSADIAYFREFYRGLRESELDVVALVREDGHMLVREPSAEPGKSRISADSGLMRAVQLAPHGVFRAIAELDGVDRLYGYAKVGDYPLYVAYGLSMRGAETQWRRTLTIYSIVTLLAIAMLLVAAELARRNSRRAVEAGEEREEQLRLRELAEEGMRQGQRLEAIGRMTGGIAHDFNNVLQVLMVNVEVLRKRIGTRVGDEAERPLAAMERATNQGTRLTRQLLSFSRRSSLRPRRTSLAAFLPELAELLRTAVRNRVALVLTVEPDVAAIEIDPDELELALLNLATNARDAMPGGGRLEVHARNVPSTAVVDGEPLGAPWVALSVKDSGTGMEPDTLHSIFDPFFTTKPVGQGTGLGLSQVYGFVTQSGGKVSVDSTPGAGTTFTLLFPSAADTKPAADDGAGLDGLRFLIVDDEADTCAAVMSVVSGAGAIAQGACSAAEALHLLAEGRFDVLLTDVRMPVCSGVQLAGEVRARHPRVAIVLMTAYPQSAEVADGPFEVVGKPVDPHNLLLAMRRAMDGVRPETAGPDE